MLLGSPHRRQDFNPRPPWGGRPYISLPRKPKAPYFNPRPPWGGRRRRAAAANRRSHFNPRPPWGGRPVDNVTWLRPEIFQSTPSVGRATASSFQLTLSRINISIHALRGEGDMPKSEDFLPFQVFQSTPSVGRATKKNHCDSEGTKYFNPRPPWGGRLSKSAIYTTNTAISIHALRGEGDRNHR